VNKRLSALVLVAAAALIAFVGTSSASAATEIGSGCSATGAFEGGEVALTHGATGPLPSAATTSGVITEWRVNVGALPTLEAEEKTELGKVLFQQLYVVKQIDPQHYQVVSKSESGLAVIDTTTSFLTRIPIAQGDFLALGGPETLFCHTKEAADSTADFRGAPAVGSFFETGKEGFTEYQVPVVAKIEPDVDGDGYGDETQDKCPQSAAYHEACPVVNISSLPTAGGNAVHLRVATSLSAPVAVTATVGLGKGKTASLTAPSQVIAPGSLAAFTLTLDAKVRNALAGLSASKSLKMTITASATNVTGAPSSSVTTVKLKGQPNATPKPKAQPKQPTKK
jgi:hypothetical protein